MSKSPVLKISILLLKIAFLISCSQESNVKEDSNSSNSDSTNYKVPEIEDLSNSITPFPNQCRVYFEELFIESGVWEPTAKMIEFVSFDPKKVVDNTGFNYTEQDGVYIYTVKEFVENEDTTKWGQAGYFSNEEQTLIPLHIEGDKIIFDSLMIVHLPFNNRNINCFNMNLDTITDQGKGYYGIWRRIDEDREPL